MIFITVLVVSAMFWAQIKADISHLKSHLNSKHFQAFSGYNYNPPIHQLPSPAPEPLPTTTFIPEIIVNKGNQRSAIEKRKIQLSVNNVLLKISFDFIRFLHF